MAGQAMALDLHHTLLLAHHPLCGQFDQDVYNIGRHRLCLGCFTSYPLAVAIVLIWWLAGLPGEWYHHLSAGFLAGSAQLASLKGLTRTRTAKVAVKTALGFGFGLATVGVLGIPVEWWWRLILLFPLSWTASMLAYFRTRSIEEICLACEWKGARDCPGFVPPFVYYRPGQADNREPEEDSI